VAALILADQGVGTVRLITNNPSKIERLAELGIGVTERVPLESTIYAENVQYLFTKALRMNHLFNLDAFPMGMLNRKNGST
jgi:GTP cyclohydrolase II